MVTNKCRFCKKLFETDNPKRTFCHSPECKIKFDYVMFHKEGVNPSALNKEIKEREWKKITDAILKNPREFLDSIK